MRTSVKQLTRFECSKHEQFEYCLPCEAFAQLNGLESN